MKYKNGEPDEGGEPSIHVDIIPRPRGGSGSLTDDRGSVFEPQREPSGRTPSGGTDTANAPAPEKKLTLFALRLAVLEKVASGLGKLAFVWATVVLLGGYAIKLDTEDFWIVTVILLIESTRIFSRSHELEWQHQSTSLSIADAGRYSFRAVVSSSHFLVRAVKAIFRPLSAARSGSSQSNRRIAADRRKLAFRSRNQPDENSIGRTWNSSNVPLLPYAGWVFLSRNISVIFYWLQLLSAVACVALSLLRLIPQDFGEITGDADKKNLKSALDIFYGLALAEALLFLTEKAYWNWKISYEKLLEKVQKESNLDVLGIPGMVFVKRFFYDSYSKSIDGSVFEGLKMDLISFARELLDSDSRDEQLIGAQVLQSFVKDDQFANYTLRKIGTNTPVIERLIEMLNWKNPAEQPIRRAAAEIISKLAGKKQNALRVVEIPGATESISSLLNTGQSSTAKPYEILQRAVVTDRQDYEYSAFNLLGLQILKKLANDHDNCWKIGNSRGLLPRIIDFTSTREKLLRDNQTPSSQIMTVKRSLQLVKMMVSTTGKTGQMLRKEISEIVFTLSNIREILQHGESHMVLQKLGVEVLTSLAMDEEARERIGSTGGLIRLLLSIFFRPGVTNDQNILSVEAGEAIAMLAVDSEQNCKQILKEDAVVQKLIEALSDRLRCINSSRILTSLCAYSPPECFELLRGVTAAMPKVMNTIMNDKPEKEKLTEVSVGLAKQIFGFISSQEYAEELKRIGIRDADFAGKLVDILKRYTYPGIKVPRMRRFVIELMIELMESQEKYIQLFKNLAAAEVLQSVVETTSQLESFSVFSGTVGLHQSSKTLSSLVDTGLKLMA